MDEWLSKFCKKQKIPLLDNSNLPINVFDAIIHRYERGKMSLETSIFTCQKETFTRISYLCIWIEATLSTTFWNNKKRYAYLVNWKCRKFHNYTQWWHSGSHAKRGLLLPHSCVRVSYDLQFRMWHLQFHAFALKNNNLNHYENKPFEHKGHEIGSLGMLCVWGILCTRFHPLCPAYNRL